MARKIPSAQPDSDAPRRAVHQQKKRAKRQEPVSRPVQTIKTRPKSGKARPRRAPEPAPELTLVKGGGGFARLRKWMLPLILLLVVALLVFMHIKAPGGLPEWITNYAAGLGSGDGFPVQASDGLAGGLQLRDGDLYLLSANNMYAFNQNGKIIYSRTHGYADPVQAVSRSRVLTFDRGGTKFRVDNKNKRLFEDKTEQAIITGAVSDRGAFALACRATGGYTSEIRIFSADFKEIYLRSFAKYLISAAALSSDGKTAAVSVIGAEDGAYISTVFLLSVGSAEPLAEIRYADRFISRLEFPGDRLVAALSENSCVILDTAGKTMGEYTARGYAAADFTGGGNGYAALFSDLQGDRARVVLFDSGGRLTGNFDVPAAVKAICAAKNELFLLEEGKVLVCDRHGKQQKEMDAPLFATDLVAGGDGVYTFDTKQVLLIK